MSKGWQCKNCKSFQIKDIKQLAKKETGKIPWMVQGHCTDCGCIMRFTKHTSFIYKLPAKPFNKTEVPF